MPVRLQSITRCFQIQQPNRTTVYAHAAVHYVPTAAPRSLARRQRCVDRPPLLGQAPQPLVLPSTQYHRSVTDMKRPTQHTALDTVIGVHLTPATMHGSEAPRASRTRKGLSLRHNAARTCTRSRDPSDLRTSKARLSIVTWAAFVSSSLVVC